MCQFISLSKFYNLFFWRALFKRRPGSLGDILVFAKKRLLEPEEIHRNEKSSRVISVSLGTLSRTRLFTVLCATIKPVRYIDHFYQTHYISERLNRWTISHVGTYNRGVYKNRDIRVSWESFSDRKLTITIETHKKIHSRHDLLSSPSHLREVNCVSSLLYLKNLEQQYCHADKILFFILYGEQNKTNWWIICT